MENERHLRHRQRKANAMVYSIAVLGAALVAAILERSGLL